MYQRDREDIMSDLSQAIADSNSIHELRTTESFRAELTGDYSVVDELTEDLEAKLWHVESYASELLESLGGKA